MQSRRQSDPAWTIFWVALVLRIGWMTFGHAYRFPAADDHWSFGWETGHIARALATGRGFSDPFKAQSGATAWIAPLYPFFLALLFKAFGAFSNAAAWWALAVNSLFSAFNCVLIYRIGSRVFAFDPALAGRVARWSAWLFALLPAMMFWAARWPWETALTAFLLSAVVLLALKMVDGATLRQWLGFGTLWGVLALTNPSTLSVLPFFGVWILLQQGERLRALRNAAAAGAVFVAMVVPWILRNDAVLKQPVFIRDNFWVEFRLGNGPGAEGYWMWWSHPSQNKLEEQRYLRLGELAYVQARKQEAVAWVEQNPAEFVKVTAKRILIFWSGVPRNERALGLELRDLNLAVFFLSSALSWTGFWLMRRRRLPGSFLFGALLIVYPMVYYLTFPHERYRHPIEPEMMLLAVFAVVAALPPKAAAQELDPQRV